MKLTANDWNARGLAYEEAADHLGMAWTDDKTERDQGNVVQDELYRKSEACFSRASAIEKKSRIPSPSGSPKWREITGRLVVIQSGDEMTRDQSADARWSPVHESLIGHTAKTQQHYNGWRIRRPVTSPNLGGNESNRRNRSKNIPY